MRRWLLASVLACGSALAGCTTTMAEISNDPEPAAEAVGCYSFIVFFDWNSSTLSPEAQAIVQDFANYVRANSITAIELVGHTDLSGTRRYNHRLSLRRAEAVKVLLIALGVTQATIKTFGKGESAPLVPTPDGAREPQNRRTEMVAP